MLRVGFFGQTGPYAPAALRYLTKHHGAFETVLVVEGRRRMPGRRATVFKRAPKKASMDTRLNDLGELALGIGLPALITSDVNGDEAKRLIAKHRLDWLVCVGFDRLFSRGLLHCAASGGINAHPSKLPRWRGPSPIFWALKNGERDFAVTLHALTPQEDAGVVYATEGFLPPRGASGTDIYRLAGQLAGKMLVPVLERAAVGALHGTPQNDELATRAPRPSPEDALVKPQDWTCEPLYNFACGAGSFRTPWISLPDGPVFVRQALRTEPGRHLPGEYVRSGSTLIVQCVDGAVHLEIQV